MALLPKSNVWDRRTRFDAGYETISERLFNFVFAITTSYGMVVFGILAAMFLTVKLNIWATLGLFVVSLVGCFISAVDFAPVKGIGLTMIAGGLGAICGPFIHQYKVASVTEIAGATVLITLILGAIGSLYPKSLSTFGGLLFSSLFALIIMQILAPLAYALMGLPITGVLHALDWLGVLIFSAYIVYDFNRAQELPKTIDNAMDCGISVFLDIANLFIRLLDLYGAKSDD